MVRSICYVLRIIHYCRPESKFNCTTASENIECNMHTHTPGLQMCQLPAEGMGLWPCGGLHSPLAGACPQEDSPSLPERERNWHCTLPGHFTGNILPLLWCTAGGCSPSILHCHSLALIIIINNSVIILTCFPTIWISVV